MKINSMLGQFAGTITFTDNTVETFHSQGEFNAPAGGTPTSLIWSVDENGSREAIKQAAWLHNPNYPVDYPHYPYWSGINVLGYAGLWPFASVLWGTAHPAAQKTITNMTARLDMTLARDDNHTYQIAAVMYDFPNVQLEGGLPWATHPPHILNQMTLSADGSTATLAATNITEVKSALHHLLHLIMDTVTVI